MSSLALGTTRSRDIAESGSREEWTLALTGSCPGTSLRPACGSWLYERVDERLTMLRGLRATRHFQPTLVPDPVLAEIIDVARWTGSARNRQPWRVAVISAAEQRRQLAGLGAYAGVLERAPQVVLLAIDHDLGGADSEFDAGRFAQTLMLAAHACGLGTCPVSFFPVDNARAACGFAGLAEPWLVRTAIAIGYPAPADHPPQGRSAIPTGRIALQTLITRTGP